MYWSIWVQKMIFTSVVLVMCLIHGFGSLEIPEKSNDHQNSSTQIKANISTFIEVDGGKDVRKAWKATDKLLRSAVGKMLKTAMPMLLREIYQRDISPNCLSSLVQFSTGLKNTKLWAFRMLDSSGRFPVGFLSGTLTALGNYEECVNLNVNESKVKLRGQYCMIEIIPPIPEWRSFLSIHLPVPELVNVSTPDSVVTFLVSFVHNLHTLNIRNGVCVPSTCTVSDVNNLVQIIPEKLGLEWGFAVEKCEVKRETELNKTQIFILCVVGVISLLLLIGTMIDFCFPKQSNGIINVQGKMLQIIRSFSVFSNCEKLSSYVPEHDEFRFFHGIMFFCIVWIVAAHSIVFLNVDILSNFTMALTLAKTFIFQVLYHRIFPIQVFLFISAFVTTYKLMKSPEPNICVWKYFLKAYWRFTPTYMLLIAVVMLCPLWGSGPTWLSSLIPMYDSCKSNWWKNMIFINNYGDPENSCLEHTWLLGVAAQLHFLGISILIPLKLRPNIGLMLNVFIATASLVTVALTNTYYNLPPNDMLAFLGVRNRYYYTERIYQKVYTHICVYSAGIFVGYLMATKPNLKISSITSFFLLLVCLAGIGATFFSLYHWHMGIFPSPVSSACYAAFSKLALAITLSCVTVCFIANPSGVVHRLLSWRPFSFLSRLTFIAFVIHPILIQTIMSFRKTHLFVSTFEIVYNILAHVVCTYIISYIFYLAIEAPLCQLTDIIRTSWGKRTSGLFSHSSSFSTKICEESVIAEKPNRFTPVKDAHDEKMTIKHI